MAVYGFPLSSLLSVSAIMLLLGSLDVDLLRGSFWSAKGKELLFFGVLSTVFFAGTVFPAHKANGFVL